MKKTVFAITATFLMMMVAFGTLSASSAITSTQAESDCVTLTGTVDGYYSTVNPCETVTLRLENVPVTITDNTYGKTQTVMTTVETSKLFGLIVVPGGEFTASVYKNMEYTVEVDVTLNFDGVEYQFTDSQTVIVGEEGIPVNFNIHGEIVTPEEKSLDNFPMIRNIINRLSERFQGIFSFF